MRILITTLSLFLLAACGQPDPEPTTDAAPAAPEPAVDVYAAAVNNEARSEADRERDADRMPAEVLEFFGIQPGMHVLDIFSGGGYYAEVASYVVGESGSVTAHSNEAYAQYVAQESLTRYGDNRLPNVTMMMAENNELALDENQFDAAIFILGFHDFYYVSPENGWPQIDAPAMLAEIRKGLKPGAAFGIVDHAAAAGSPRETGNTLHRIDPAIVIEDMEAAGFVLESRSDLLRNPNDDHSLNMADPAIRGKTDRLVMLFRNPG